MCNLILLFIYFNLETDYLQYVQPLALTALLLLNVNRFNGSTQSPRETFRTNTQHERRQAGRQAGRHFPLRTTTRRFIRRVHVLVYQKGRQAGRQATLEFKGRGRLLGYRISLIHPPPPFFQLLLLLLLVASQSFRDTIVSQSVSSY